MKIILLLGSRRSTLGSVFMNELSKLGGHLDEIILCDGMPSISTRIMNRLSGRRWYEKISTLFFRLSRSVWRSFHSDLAPMEQLWAAWAPHGENSWDLLKDQVFDVVEYAREHGVPMTHIPFVESERFWEHLKNQGRAAVICYGGGILRKKLFEALPDVIFLNSHMARVPPFRGMNVAEWSVLKKIDAEVTIMKMDAGIDTGDIVYRKTYSTNGVASISELRKSGYLACCRTMAEYVHMIRSKAVEAIPQKKEEGESYYCIHDDIKGALSKRLAGR